MIQVENITKGFKTAESRWARFGPYYAMFPVEFAFDVISRYSKPGDYILDPFAGRSTSIYAGGVLGRHSLGIEINPVGWLYGCVKLNPSSKEAVSKRLFEVSALSNTKEYRVKLELMSEFFRMCYCDNVLKFLLAARDHLDWQYDEVDATLMSIILVYLHAKIGEGLSNQMRMTKAMGIQYSIEWWKKNGFSSPPEINPVELLTSKINWRYAKGAPEVTASTVLLGDSTNTLNEVVKKFKKNDVELSLLFTSPPYNSVTNYYADQWLRLWMLGGEPQPKYNGDKHTGRFRGKDSYSELLNQVFGKSAQIMAQKSTVYVRTDKREFTFSTTLNLLKKHFPKHNVEIIEKPLKANTKTQTKLYGDKSLKPGEVDIILSRW